VGLSALGVEDAESGSAPAIYCRKNKDKPARSNVSFALPSFRFLSDVAGKGKATAPQQIARIIRVMVSRISCWKGQALN
jgi:hypothetical protein